MPAPPRPAPHTRMEAAAEGARGLPPVTPRRGLAVSPCPPPAAALPLALPLPVCPQGIPGRGLTASTPSSWEGVRTGKPDGGSFLPHGSQRDPGVLPARPNPGVPPGSREGPSALATSVCAPAPPAPAPSLAQPVPTSNPGGRN